jgi:adenylate kinase family enzyme
MVVKLFLMGLPRSGKSTVAYHIAEYVKGHYRNRSVHHMSDYDILYKKFQHDTERKYFTPIENGGFNIHNLEILDVALEEFKKKANAFMPTAAQGDLLILEFARNDYSRAFNILSSSFIHDAYFLFLDVNVEICKERNRARITHKSEGMQDDHYVSEDIFRIYYYTDDKQYIASGLKEEHNIDDHRISIMDNGGALQDIDVKVRQFVDLILKGKA